MYDRLMPKACVGVDLGVQDVRKKPALSSVQQKAFAMTNLLARQFTSLPNAGGSANIVAAMTMACGACHGAFQFQCPGRTDWQQPCRLVQ
jgi:hypothetical protein